MKTVNTVARAYRMEIDPNTEDLYLVFKVIDVSFKKRIRESWSRDVELQILGKDLVEITEK
jgi:hypothetical protein